MFKDRIKSAVAVAARSIELPEQHIRVLTNAADDALEQCDSEMHSMDLQDAVLRQSGYQCIAQLKDALKTSE